MTRLLNTPIIGRLVASVDSSSIDMLAGLSKWPILRIPPCFAPMPSPWAATARSLSRAREDLASFRPPPVRNAGGKDPHCRCAGPFWAFAQAATSERLSSIGLRGTGARYRRSIALLLARLAGKRLLVEPEVFEARAAHSRALARVYRKKFWNNPMHRPMRRNTNDFE